MRPPSRPRPAAPRTPGPGPGAAGAPGASGTAGASRPAGERTASSASGRPVPPPPASRTAPPAPPSPTPRRAATSGTSGTSGRDTSTVADAPDTATAPLSLARARALAAAGSGAPPVVSTAMADRLAERDAMRRHRLRRRALGAVGGAAAAGAALWVVLFSPVLGLDPQEVVVTGEGTTVDVGQVRAVLDAQAGVPLPRLDTVALREQVLDLGGVKDVRILRTWPDGLDVALTARVPVAAVPDGGAWVLLDGEGVRVGTAEQVPEGLPEVSVPLDADSARSLRAALVVLAALPDDLRTQVASVGAQTQDDVEMTLHDGVTVRWGGGEQVNLKVKVVQTLRAAAPEARVIDVSSPELPVTR